MNGPAIVSAAGSAPRSNTMASASTSRSRSLSSAIAPVAKSLINLLCVCSSTAVTSIGGSTGAFFFFFFFFFFFAGARDFDVSSASSSPIISLIWSRTSIDFSWSGFYSLDSSRETISAPIFLNSSDIFDKVWKPNPAAALFLRGLDEMSGRWPPFAVSMCS